MKKFTFVILSFITLVSARAQENSWIRHAAISPDGNHIVFTFKGDLFLVPSQGGDAIQLTYHEAHDYTPVWSNDGKTIAFASNRFGNFDIYKVSVAGGEPTRLTFHSNDEHPFTFTNDDQHILFGAQIMDDKDHRQFPTGSQPEVYRVSTSGGRVYQEWTIPAEALELSKDGSVIVYHDKKGGENYFRKHHTSSITRDLWVYNTATGEHKMLTDFPWENRTPVFSPDQESLFYLSEESGNYNVHKIDINNNENRSQVTSFKTNPARYLSISDDGTLCYTQNGDLYVNRNGSEQKVPVNITTARKTNNEQILTVSGNVREMAVSPDGKEVAFIARGEIFVSSVDGKLTRRISNTPGQERFLNFTEDGKGLIYAAEREGVWSIYKTTKANEFEPYFFASTVLKEEKIISSTDGVYEPKVSPDGKKIAYIEGKTTLKVLNLDDNTTRTLLTPNELFYFSDGDQEFNWSPDSKWLAIEYSPQLANSEVIIMPVDKDGSWTNLTESGYGDYSPVWSNDGERIVWFGNRDGMRSYANSGRKELDVYAFFLTKDAWDKYRLPKDEYELMKELEEADKKKDEEKESKKKKKRNSEEEQADSTEVKIDWNGLKDRKARLTIHSSRLRDAVLSKDGEYLYYLTSFEKGVDLWSTNLRTKETKLAIELGARNGSLMWDKKQENLFLLADGRISKLDVKAGKKTNLTIGNDMNLDESAEYFEMFEHVWTRTRDMFYTSDYHGIDWQLMHDNYVQKVPLIGNDVEFAELLSEMLGELNVSHSGARFRPDFPNEDNTAALGIFYDLSYDGNGVLITEVLRDGPLDKADLSVTAGMIITKINGVEITPATDFSVHLNRLEGKFTALEIRNPADGKVQNITVKPISLGDQGRLLYKRWVRQNEQDVKKLSKGKVGYVHIPGMGDSQYRSAYEDVMGKYHDTDVLIVDTRFNGGGDLVSDLAMFLTGRKFIDYSTELRDIGYEPGWRWTKPSVAMVNEAQYSDGHCFACGYKDLGIGKLIGMPVPGTCSFAGWETLQNGTVRWGAVPLSAKDINGNWMENNQTEPDIRVKNYPGSIDKGVDQQLQKAVEVALDSVN